MRQFAMLVGICALGLTVVPPVLSALEIIPEPSMKALCLDGAILWFVSAPAFMRGGSK